MFRSAIAPSRPAARTSCASSVLSKLQLLKHLNSLRLVKLLPLGREDAVAIFLGAADNVLIKRFSETRRKHPLTRVDVSLLEAIAVERELLAPIAASADLHIDTSNFNVHQLRGVIRERVAQHKLASLSILFISFGYKYGIPTDADFVFDDAARAYLSNTSS